MARVLIVDDSPAWRATARAALTAAGHEVIAEATDGFEALAACREHHPDLVTLDIQMPNMDGIACLEVLRGTDPELPVVMVSAASGQSMRHRARTLGASGFVPKPYEPADLMHAVEEALQ